MGRKHNCHKCHCHCKRDHELRFMTKNMSEGFDYDPGVDGLPGYNSVIGDSYAVPTGPNATIDKLAQTFENMWRQTNEEQYLWTTQRLDQMAKEIADVNPDVLSLQNAMIFANNPVGEFDDTRFFNLELCNGVYGEEDSPEETRVYDYTKMIIKRLKSQYGLDYIVASRQLGDANQAPRSGSEENAFNNAKVNLSIYQTVALLIKKDLKPKLIRQQQRTFQYSRDAQSSILFDNDGNEIRAQFTITVWRGYNSVDVKIKGKTIRIVNVYFASGNRNYGPTADYNPPYTVAANSRDWIGKTVEYESNSCAVAMEALEMREQEIIPSPYPVVLTGDFNTESSFEQNPFFGRFFPVGGYRTLVDSGVMVDVGEKVLGKDVVSTTPYKTGSLTSGGGGGADWDRMRNPDNNYRFRLDYIMYRDGDSTEATGFNVSQVNPVAPPIPNSFRWTSTHNGVYADLKFKSCH